MIKLSPKQSKLYNLAAADTNLIIACGTIRSGKSLAGIYGYLHYVMTTFRNDDHIVGCFSELVWEGTILKYAEDWCRLTRRTIKGNSKGFVITGRDPNSGRIVRNTFYRITGSSISAARRLRGLGDAQTVWATEVALFPYQVLDELNARLANSPVETRRMVWDLNPEGGPDYWFKTDYMDPIARGEKDGLLFDDFGPDDNPDMTPEKWKVTCDQYAEGPEKMRKTENLWVPDAGLVHDFVKYDVVVKHPTKQPKYLDVGIDTADSGVTHAVLVGHYSVDYCVLDNWRYDGKVSGRMSPSEQIDQIISTFSPYGRIARWVSDTNGGFLGTLRDYERDGKIAGKVFDPYKKRDIGIETTNRMLQSGQLKVSERCSELIRDAGRYSYGAKDSAEGEDKAVKKDDHGPDALRYWVMMNAYGMRNTGRPILVRGGL